MCPLRVIFIFQPEVFFLPRAFFDFVSEFSPPRPFLVVCPSSRLLSGVLPNVQTGHRTVADRGWTLADGTPDSGRVDTGQSVVCPRFWASVSVARGRPVGWQQSLIEG